MTGTTLFFVLCGICAVTTKLMNFLFQLDQPAKRSRRVAVR